LRGAIGLIINGLVAVSLALLVWRLTGSVLGWGVLFIPGSVLVSIGTIRVFRGEE
jgi:hypothetical protein